jgi:hypothetical protein
MHWADYEFFPGAIKMHCPWHSSFLAVAMTFELRLYVMSKMAELGVTTPNNSKRSETGNQRARRDNSI